MEQEKDLKFTEGQKEAGAGMVKIADDVVAMIASIAAREVEGVAAMTGDTTSELMNKVGVRKGKGVKVEIKNGIVHVGLSVMLEYGYNIPATCSNIQTRVKTAIENMTGLEVSDVNIRISGITMTN